MYGLGITYCLSSKLSWVLNTHSVVENGDALANMNIILRNFS